jgi:potassium-transporting ATPase KdpC subunit
MKLLAKVPKSITFLLGMTILTGVLYPAALTLAAQLVFPSKANGSLLVIKGAVRGSRLLAQKFESPRFFRARPSASDYTYVGAGGSNLGPVSAELAKAVAERRDAWAKDFGTSAPEDMPYASASGLDPDIGLEAALAQADRVAGARSLSSAAKAALIGEINKAAERSTTLIGPPRVNVVSLNAQLVTDPVFRDARDGG